MSTTADGSGPSPEGGAFSRWRERVETLLVWAVGHASKLWPFVVLAVVVYLTSDALRRVHPRALRAVLRDIDTGWIAVASAGTLVNIAVMGLYDLVAFRHTRATWRERWEFGAVAFAWSNFLTLGPLAGPAVRLWLYRPFVDDVGVLPGGIVSVSIAFVSGLAGWTAACLVLPPHADERAITLAVLAAALAVPTATLARRIAARVEALQMADARWRTDAGLALVGWLDWLLAAGVFVACLRSANAQVTWPAAVRSFFFGQAIGLASLVPGGFGSSDAFWITHLPDAESIVAGALVAYRAVYYIVPWAGASLLLLAVAARRGARHASVARLVLAGLVGLGGAAMLLSVASPSIQSRLAAMEDVVPLPLVEVSTAAAAAAGLLLLVIARGLARGYRAAHHATILLLALGGVSALLKGLDWEEAVLMALLAGAVWSQSGLFDRRSHGRWLEGRDVGLAAGGLALFVIVGAFAHSVTAHTFTRLYQASYDMERVRFVRAVLVLVTGVLAAALYVTLRVPVRFTRLREEDIERTLAIHARLGRDSAAMTVANGDKDVFFWNGDRGLCLYRTVGPYLVVLGDPTIGPGHDRGAFVDDLWRYATDLDRRPLFYQISLDWLPALHDRGFDFFKLGEEAIVPLARVTLDGSAGKENRQFLRRGERDGLSFQVWDPATATAHLADLKRVSDEWLQAKHVKERQFSIGWFDEQYLSRFPCAVVLLDGTRVVAFANLLLGPGAVEASVDLMRYAADAPRGVMDYLFVSLFLHARQIGYERFSLGMAPLATVGSRRGAHLRERLAHLLFQHGEHWYNFQGLRSYKEKWAPLWVPRYMAYGSAWEWPAAITNVSALVAGGWTRILRGA